MKNKTIFFKTWPSSGRLDAYLAKNLATIKNVLYKRTPLHRLKEYNESLYIDQNLSINMESLEAQKSVI